MTSSPRRGSLDSSRQPVGGGVLTPPRVPRTFRDLDAFKQDRSVLLVFPKANDSQCTAFADAVYRLNLSCYYATSEEDARNSFDMRHHSIVIIDSRNLKQLDAIFLCKLLRTMDGSAFSVFVAVRTRDVKIRPELFEAGFDQDFLELPQAHACFDELQYMFRRAAVHAKMRFAEALFAACEWADESIEIGNADHKIQYVNPACMKAFGYSQADLSGRHVDETLRSNKNPDDLSLQILKQLDNGRPWSGSYSVQKRSGESVMHVSRIVPIKGQSGRVFGFATLRQIVGLPCAMCHLPQEVSPSRRRTSLDRRSLVHFSDNFGHPSLHPQMMNLITGFRQSNSSPLTLQVLDQLTDYIRQSNAGSTSPSGQSRPPNLSSGENEVAEEMVEGLMVRDLSDDNLSRRARDLTSLTSSKLSLNNITARLQMLPLLANPDVQHTLDLVLTWEFNVISLEKLCKLKCLQYAGFVIFMHFEAQSLLQSDERTIFHWLVLMESFYRHSNPYHNSSHATDVLQASAFFCSQPKLVSLLDPMDQVAIIIAAVIHDLDHVGRTNSFLINAQHELAMLYNDISVLENHHASHAFIWTQKDPHANIFKNLNRDQYKALRQQIIDLVLATDMTKHFDYLKRFKEHLPNIGRLAPNWSPSGHSTPAANERTGEATASLHSLVMTPAPLAPETRTIIKRMVIKVSDVSNPIRPLDLCKTWAQRIAEEYFRQTEEEKAKGLPVVMPIYDRETCNIPKTQITFSDLFINQMMGTWNEFCPVPQLMKQMVTNYDYWKDRLDMQTQNP